MAELNKLLRVSCVGLLFILTLSILIHTNTNLDQDLGRHIKTGEIIWQTKSVPKTNLFSYTHPDFTFINHHWGSEVIFYLLYKHFGFLSITYLKIGLIFLSVLIILYTSTKISSFPISLISLTLFLPLLASRSDERPEIFGFLFFALFLAIFIKFKQNNYQGRAIWILPFVQLLWTNFHITFIYGFLLIFLFLIDILINCNWRAAQNTNSKHHGPRGKTLSYPVALLSWLHVQEDVFKQASNLLIILFFAVILSLLNPNGISGLLYPLNVLRNYGYTIVENQNLFYLSSLTSNIFIKIFWIQAAILTVVGSISFLLSLKAKTIKTDIFYLFLVSCFLFLSILMYRNLPFFAFTAIICFSYFLKKISQYINSQNADSKHHGPRGKALSYFVDLLSWLHVRENAFKNLTYFILIFINSIYISLTISNIFYKTFDINKKFELRVDSSYEKAVDSFIKNQLPGPIFNNFDIGGYLDFRLYTNKSTERVSSPEGVPSAGGILNLSIGTRARQAPLSIIESARNVFVDNRPEAYPSSFFEEYKAAQLYPDQLEKLINKYKINSIIFSHTDSTDWGSAFVKNIKENKDFRIVYADSTTFIAVKTNLANLPEVKKEDLEKIVSRTNDYLELLHIARLLNTWSMPEHSFKALKKSYILNPKSCATRLSYGSSLIQQSNLFTKNLGIQILKSTRTCPYPKNIKNQLNQVN